MNVELIMSTKVLTASPGDTLGEIKKMFEQVSYHHLLVEENGKLVGVISDRDMLSAISPFLGTEDERQQDIDRQQIPVSEIMSGPPISVDRYTSIDIASILLLENEISCLPVVNNEDEIEGIMTWKDILKYQVYGGDIDEINYG